MYFYMSNFWFFCPAHWPSKTFFEIVKSPYWFDILFHQTLIKSLGGTNIVSFSKEFNSLSLCLVYLVLFYKPFQTFIIYFTNAVTIQHPVRLIVDWFLYIYIFHRSYYRNDKIFCYRCILAQTIVLITGQFKRVYVVFIDERNI